MTTSGVYGFVTLHRGRHRLVGDRRQRADPHRRQALQRKVDTSKGETAVPSDDGSGRAFEDRAG
jgi:hypothetical protein